MKLRHLTCLALVWTGTAFAAGAPAKVVGTPQPTRQAPAPGVATFGLPNPAGLTPPVPGALAPPMPASLTPPGAPDLTPGAAPGSVVVDAAVAGPTTTGGVAAVQSGGYAAGTNAMGYGGIPRGPYSAVDIERAFEDADINHDGDLSRAEAQRLAIPVPFDELDRNHDGVLTRFEYQDYFQ